MSTKPYRPISPDLVSRETAASFLQIGIRKLDRATTEGRVPPPYRFNEKCILYSLSELQDFVLAQPEWDRRKNARAVQPGWSRKSTLVSAE